MEKVTQNKKPKMAERKAFTVVEILLSLAVVGILFGLIFAFYRSSIEKSKYVEAVATVDAISKAEEINQMNTGEYVAAANTQEVNEKLGLDIQPRWYNYKVIGVTKDNFIVLAEKILDDINSGNLSSEPTVIAKNLSGPVSPESVGPTDESSPADGESSSPGGGPPSPGGGTPANSNSSETNPGGGNPGGGGGGSRQTIHPKQTAVPTALLDLLKDTVSGDWAYDLIHNNSIPVVYVNPDDYGISGALAWWAGIYDQTFVDVYGNYVFVTGNTIFINQNLLSQGYTESAIASIITHESNHADYQYHGQTWIDATKAAHPELTDSEIHISPTPDYYLSDTQKQGYPFNSIDQEYQGFDAAVDVWNEIKGADTNAELDYWANLKATGGENAMKTAIRALYGVNPPDAGGLPEY
jgi:Tfp pilus assembly protein PilE